MQSPSGAQETGAAGVVRALAELPLFRGCSRAFVEAVAACAERCELFPNETLEAWGSPYLAVVAQGALRLQLGPGPKAVLGPGLALNFVGFLGLEGATGLEERAPQERPPKEAARDGDPSDSPYTLLGFAGLPLEPFRERAGAVARTSSSAKGDAEEALTDEQLCFFSLCPSAAAAAAGAAKAPLALTAAGARGDETPVFGSEDAPFKGVALLLVPQPLRALDGSTQREFQLDLDCFQKNCKDIFDMWQSLMKWFAPVVLPGAPAEVVWAIAEVSERTTFREGSAIAHEGDIGRSSSDFFVIERGRASVKKLLPAANKQAPHPETIGSLQAGAVIGDLLLQSGNVPRAATALAQTDVVTVSVSRKKLLDVLVRFPGALAGVEDRLFEGAKMMMERLPARIQMLHSLNYFEGCDMRFVADLAAASERRIVLGGQTVIEQGGACSSLWVLEQGRCCVEVRGRGRVDELRPGACFGERTLFGITHSAEGTVRASAPVILLLSLPKGVLNACLEEHMEEKPRFDRLKKSLGKPGKTGPTQECPGKAAGTEGLATPRRLRIAELFRPCGGAFLQALDAVLETHLYMPSQTIVIENLRELDARMFVLTGGMAVAERAGRRVARMTRGATFGELAMLGVTQQRCTTVRAMTFVMAVALQRSLFFKALQQHPEEEPHFQEVLNASRQDAIMWPCLQEVAPALLQALDMQAEARKFVACDATIAAEPINMSAILIVGGQVAVVNEHEDEVDVLSKGSCFNEQILAGAGHHTRLHLLPKTNCDTRVLSRKAWEKALAEFPEERERAIGCVLNHMGNEAEKRLGHAPGTGAILRSAMGFLQNASAEFLTAVRAQLETRLVLPGEVIANIGQGRQPTNGSDATESSSLRRTASRPGLAENSDSQLSLILLLDGQAEWEDELGVTLFESGSAFFEAAALGLEQRCPGMLRTAADGDRPCLLQALPRSALLKVLAQHPGDQEVIQKLLLEVRSENQTGERRELWRRLQKSTSFLKMDPGFMKAVSEGVQVKVFPAGTMILRQGERCIFGQSEFFLVLGGKVHLQSERGTVFRTVHAGELVGELGAFGLMDERTASASVWLEGLACCACFQGASLKAAVEDNPDGFEGIMAAVAHITEVNSNIEQDRRRWIQDVAIPALINTPLLASCPEDFVEAMASTLTERSFPQGVTISSQGELSREMVVILEGTAELMSKTGAHAGVLGAGATFGEVAALGLFPACLATIRAATACRVLTLPEAALRRSLAMRGREELAGNFRAIVESRQEQVRTGMPICAMGYDAPKNSVSVRTIALLSEKLLLEPGEAVQPIGDSNPGGAMLAFLVRGRLAVELGESFVVTSLSPGSVVLESMAAEFGATFRAETQCELYGIKRVNFELAVGSAPTEQWLWHFKLQERKAHDSLNSKLQNARGVTGITLPHRRDKELHEWKVLQKRRAAQRRAAESGLQRLPAVQRSLWTQFLPESAEEAVGSSDVNCSRGEHSQASSPSAPSQTPSPSAPSQMESPCARGVVLAHLTGDNFFALPSQLRQKRKHWPTPTPPNRSLDSYPVLGLVRLPKLGSQASLDSSKAGMRHSPSAPELRSSRINRRASKGPGIGAPHPLWR